MEIPKNVLGMSGKQTFALLCTITICLTLVVRPELVEWLAPIAQQVNEAAIDEWNDQGVGGSPYQTWKASDAGVVWVNVTGTIYYCYMNGDSGKMQAYSTNKTEIQDWAINNVTAGSVYIKENAFESTNVTVPENVMVIEQLNGVQKRYINVADTQGSPYTISTDSTNYFAQDSTDSYINSWTSTDSVTVFEACDDSLTSGGKIFVKDATYTFTAKWTINNPLITVEGESWNTVLTIANAVDDDVIFISGDNCTIRNIAVDGNIAGQTGGYGKGINVDGGDYSTIENSYVHHTYSESIFITGASGVTTGHMVSSCLVDASGLSGISFYGTASGSVEFSVVSDCVIKNSGIRTAGNNLWFKDTNYCIASDCVLDTCSDESFGLGAVHQNTTGNVFTGLTATLSTNTAYHIEGLDATHRAYDTILSDFHAYDFGNGGQSGLLINNYVEKLEVSDGTLNDCNAYGIMIDVYCSDVTIDSVIIDGSVDDGVWIVDSNTANITLSKITVLNAGDMGIFVANAPYTSVIDCKVSDSVDISIYFYTGSKYTCRGNTVFSSASYGIMTDSVTDFSITDNWLEAGASRQIRISSSDRGKISDNHIIDTASGQVGIDLATGSDYNLVSDNYIYNPTATSRTGIHLYSNDQNVISGNYIHTCAVGIHLEAGGNNPDNSTISENIIRNSAVAVDIDTNASFTWFIGNDLRTNTDDVADQGTSTIWTDNLDRLGAFHEADAPDV